MKRKTLREKRTEGTPVVTHCQNCGAPSFSAYAQKKHAQVCHAPR